MWRGNLNITICLVKLKIASKTDNCVDKCKNVQPEFLREIHEIDTLAILVMHLKNKNKMFNRTANKINWQSKTEKT